jgi:hypothetical protein
MILRLANSTTMRGNLETLRLVGVMAVMLGGCGNTVIVDGSGGAGGQGGAATSSHASVSGSTVTHASSNQSSVDVSGSTSQISSTDVGTSVVSVSVSSVSVSTSIASTNVSATSVTGTTSQNVSSSATGGPPPGWKCDPSFYAHNDGCDCGCGVFDPDCANTSSNQCAFCDDPGSCSVAGGCPGSVNPANNAFCLPVVPENCSNHIDDDFDGLIDCADPDCLGQPGCAPLTWKCDPAFYLDSTCDCGCGALDPACANATSAACTNCNDAGSCSSDFCPGFISAGDNAHCAPAVPEICNNGIDDDQDSLVDCDDPDCQGHPGCAPIAWTCSLSFYKHNDGCDCGCGAFDPDCPDATAASCEFCNDAGSCDMSGNCPGNINPIKNGTCN